ncbi:MAG: cytochrome c oxidase assembly protein [Sporichthya sp.]|nr:cytochrome c oxidase assembly protein [Sporichthya sp.]
MTGVVRAHSGPHDPGPALEGSRWLTEWTVEPLALLGIALAGGLYLLGVRTMHKGTNPWPISRTVSFLTGLGWLLIAVASPLASYDTVLISVHMVQHMMLAMLGPLFLVLGAPITLALRTLPARGRSLVLTVIHSRVAAVLTHPVVAGAIFVINPFVLYFSGLYEQTLEHPWLHDANHIHFVMVGTLWYSTLLAIDPLPRRPEYPIRVIAVFLTLPFHAWLGVAIMSMSTLIAGDWYLGMDRPWGASPLSDQKTAGGILWVSGDLIGLVVFAALFRGWIKDSEREARREDRRLDRLEAAEAARAVEERAAGGPAPRAPAARESGKGRPAPAFGPRALKASIRSGETPGPDDQERSP